MTDNSVIRLHRDGPEGTGLTFRGHLENETDLEGEPTETGHNKGLSCTRHMPEITRKYDAIFDAAAGT